MQVINELESEVRSYCRCWPVTFTRASGHTLSDSEGNEYLDFFAGAGALNYGHNDPAMKAKLVEYLLDDGIVHSLDMATTAKEAFLTKFNEVILKPRGLAYKMMFPGPTGTNAVEAALKLARKVTGRDRVISFTNAFHGMTLGSLSVSGNTTKRAGAGMMIGSGVPMPYDGYLGKDVDTIEYLERFLTDRGSGMDAPAAVITETVQAEGGLRSASTGWLQRLQELCRRHGILHIVDDIQAGCGRTGTFFSFESAGITPDIVCLSKSLSGYGLPLALVLIRPDIDLWSPGEHNGTFRGHNPAFVTATEALRHWETPKLANQVAAKAERVDSALQDIAGRFPELETRVRGRGLVKGLAFKNVSQAPKVREAAFERRLILETSGPRGEVVKLLPPLTIEDGALDRGLEILEESVSAVLGGRMPARAAV
ncbi:MAG TPA: diaminobutyrate--2-oxoglutarate transaminase [Actinomycetota bacterium]|nr:diaminobutyrate--2-oxoglutarate transaminase [Actinomycetota bacterium]